MYRNTFLEIDLENIENNVKKVIENHNDYKYYFGVVKADCYGHSDLKTVRAVIKGGCNYLSVATLDEAIEIRKEIKDIPILCMGVITREYIDVCKEQNITITIPSLKYMEELENVNVESLKAHIKLNTGMNRLGIKEKEDLKKAYEIAKDKKIEIEGIFTHMYNANNQEIYNNQISKFNEITSLIPLEEIKIIHTSASDAMSNYEKPQNINGCRLGIIMYGFTNRKELKLESTFSLKSQVIQINELNPGETVGYDGTYEAEENERIAVVAIGYADGISRQNKGRMVFINGKEYPIVGNVCMDMLFVKIDDCVKLYDEVEILKDVEHIKYVADYLGTVSNEILCSIGKRVPRVYR